MSSTPYPWSVEGAQLIGWGGEHIARINSTGTKEGKANARLIALAPEMLEALILCRPWMYEYASNTPDDAFDNLCAVMEKALGDQP